mgnify:CR=1 FL=1|jgi:ubiquitin-like modifier-activating enzyme ATG7
MPPLQFQPLSSQPTPSFWSALNTLKLDKLKLDDTQQDIAAWLEEGKEITDRESAGAQSKVGVDGSVGVGGGAFDQEIERCVWRPTPISARHGRFCQGIEVCGILIIGRR